MPYDVLDKTSRFALPYGVANVHSGNGKLTRHKTAVVGNDLQVTAQLALAQGILHAVKKITYDGQDIPAANYHFFKGAPGETAADSFFPTDVNHPGASFINYSLPAGMKVDNQPDKAVVQLECRETWDYDSAGAPTVFGYSPSPARAVADGIKIITGSTDIIEWGAWDEYKSWCAAQIPITKDGATVYVDRFRLDVFFAPPFTLKTFLDRICQLTCSDYQERKGKIRMMPAINRDPSFTYDLTKLAREFKFQAIKAKDTYNGVRGAWRDLADPLLKEAQQIIVDRRTDENEPENFYDLNLSNCYRDQGERTVNFWTKTYCDLKDFALIKGSFKSYPVLPCDIVSLYHPVPAWNNKRCKVIKKTENEETGIGYGAYVRVEPVDPYSDTDFTPVQTRTAVTGANPYAAPPLPTLTVVQDSGFAGDGSVVQNIVGTVNFGAFAFKQGAKVYWMKPGEEYKFWSDLTPDASNNAIFHIPAPPSGINYFKVIPFNSDYFVFNNNLSTANQKSINVIASDFIVDGQHISISAFRANTGLAPDGSYTGKDTLVLPREAVTAWVDSASILNGEIICVLGIKFLTLAGAHNQTDSVNGATINVYNCFGVKIKTFSPAGITSRGGQAYGQFTRLAADVYEGQCYFEILISNSRGTSLPIYLHYARVSDSPMIPYTISNTPPVKKEVIETPRNLKVTAINYNTLNISYINYVGVNIYYRAVGTAAWTLHTVNWNGATAINPFPSDSNLEIQLRDYEVDSDRSEIVRVTTPPQPVLPPSRLAPTGLTVIRNPSNPTSGLIPSWQRNAADNTGVELYCFENNTTYSLAAGDTNKIFSSLGEGQRLTFKVRNVFSGSLYSDWTATATEVTDTTAVVQPPTMTGGYYDDGINKNILQFAANAGTGNFKAQYREGGADSWHDLGATILSTDTSFSHSVLQTSVRRYFEYKISRANDVGGYSAPLGVEIPIREIYSPPPLPGGCFLAGTRVMSASWWRRLLLGSQLVIFGRILLGYYLLFKPIEKVIIGEKVYSPGTNGKLLPKAVLKTFIHDADEYFNIRFSGKDKPTNVTGEHPYKILNGSFVCMSNLMEGDRILSRDRGKQISRVIIEKKIIKKKVKVFNFEVDDFQTYNAEQDDVHNKAPNNPDV